MQLSGPRDGDFESLCVFSEAIQSAVADLSNGGHIHDLLAPGLLYQVTSKLPPILMQKWGEMMFHLQPRAATLIDFDQWLDSRVMAETWAAPILTSPSNANRQRSRTTKSKEEPPKMAGRPPKIFNTTQPTTCVLCSVAHTLPNCSKFKKWSPKERSKFAIEKRHCFRCLLAGHPSKGCSTKKPCTQENCKSFNHPMMHGAPRVSWTPSTEATKTTTTASSTTKDLTPPPILKKGSAFCIKRASTGQVLLAVVKLKVEANGHSFITYALVDQGSELSLMTQQTLRALKLRPPTEEMLVGTLHGDALISVQKADVTISSLDGSFSFAVLELPAVKTFNLQPAVIDWPKEKLKYPHLADLDLGPVDFSKITVFLGSDYQDALEELETRKSTPESPGPWGIRTVFGWCVRGPLCKATGRNTNHPSFYMLKNHKQEPT